MGWYRKFEYKNNKIIGDIEYKGQQDLDYVPQQIKSLDFISLDYNEKRALAALYVVSGHFDSLFTLRNYEEGKTSLYKDGDIWQVYKIKNGKVEFPASFSNAYEACEELITRCMYDDVLALFKKRLEVYSNPIDILRCIEKMRNKYKVIEKNEDKFVNGIDFKGKIKLLDFDSLDYRDKLYICTFWSMNREKGYFTFKNYEEDKWAVFKVNGKWYSYFCKDGKIYNINQYDNAFNACACLVANNMEEREGFDDLSLYDLVSDRDYPEAVLDYDISAIKKEYKNKDNSFKKHL